ncbi:hypothetical protein FGO68_gene2245 [Halteria grandinella]|uniref:Uncharacterized protein n=1 Tax=Halteria grandinella TaxID=5974 RepID=A0A8J8P3V1_HALGN|nr:hypothetical protein FGO68_gene2245 [Halteria grandinella]
MEQAQPAQQYISQNGHIPFKQQQDQDVELLDQSNNRSRSNIWWQNSRNSSQFNAGALGLQQEYKYQ